MKNSKTYRISLTIISLIIFVLFESCKEESFNQNNITQYQAKYMDNPAYAYPLTDPPYDNYSYSSINTDISSNKDTVFVEYKNNKISKKNGYFFSPIRTSGFPIAHFIKEIYDTLIYKNNQITILTKESPNSQVNIAANQKDIFLENGKIIKTIQYYEFGDKENYTVYFTYTNNKLSKKIGYLNNKLNFQSDFYFNSDNNLDSIVSRTSKYNRLTNTIEIDLNSKRRIKEVFENYDKYSNQLKQFYVFDETFNRSLSMNNYTKSNYYFYDENGEVLNEWHIVYNLKYENGNVDFCK